jgi:cytochrome P450
MCSLPVPINLLTALSDDTLPGDYCVEKDTVMLYSAYIIHRNPEFWPNPEKFDPSRWLGDPPKPFTYLPFHGGPRLCLGMDMAFLEARVALVILLRKWKFVPTPGFSPILKVR